MEKFEKLKIYFQTNDFELYQSIHEWLEVHHGSEYPRFLAEFRADVD